MESNDPTEATGTGRRRWGRRLAVVAGVLAVLLAVLAALNRQLVGDVYTYFFPDGPVEDAEDRTDQAAPVVEGADLPAASTTPADPSTTQPQASTTQPPSAVPPPTLRAVEGLGIEAFAAGPPVAYAQVDDGGDGSGSQFLASQGGEVLLLPAVPAGTADAAGGLLDPRVVIDLTDVVSTGGERGLLGLAIDPDGDRLHVDFTNADGDTEIRSFAIADIVGSDEPLGIDDSVLHLTIGQPFRNHNGGHLAFGPDGALWIGTGDGGSANDPADLAQDPDSLLGKMLRVRPDPDGGISALDTNPDWGGRPEIWAIGLRNPWRYSFDRATGLLWVADVGQNEIEEVTVVDPGDEFVDFGWNTVEGSNAFAGEPSPDFASPSVEYTHAEGCSITGGYVYRGERIPDLAGWYLFGDYCTGWIRAVPADDPGTEPVQLVDGGIGQILSFGERADGELLVLTTSGVFVLDAES